MRVTIGVKQRQGSIRFGLSCLFRNQPTKFGNTGATAIARMRRPDALVKLSRLCMANTDARLASLRFCADHGNGCFRINSQILPFHAKKGPQTEA